MVSQGRNCGMLVLAEKSRAVLLLFPGLVLDGKVEEIIDRFEDRYLEVKARKRSFLTRAQAEEYFWHLPHTEVDVRVDGATAGLSEVVVIEHLDGDVIERAVILLEELQLIYGAGNMHVSQDTWECLRDTERFFPHLDAMPVERTLALIKPDALARGKVDRQTLEDLVEEKVAAAGLIVVAKRKMVLKKCEAETVCEDLRGSPDFDGAVGVLLKEPGVVALCLEGRGAIGKWLLMCGPANSGAARDRAPGSLRAVWGTDGTSNAVHGSASLSASERELDALFPSCASPNPNPSGLALQRTLCIVKPDGMPHLQTIRSEIQGAGFTIIRQKQTTLSADRARELYRDHAGKPSFNSIVREATSGPCCLMVLCRLEAVAVWQQLIGPESVKEARRIRPRSLRARLGRDGQRNAVHGSDGVKNANREVRFFFPELGADPVPDDDDVRDFLFRKSAGASMDLKSLADTDNTDFTVDPTLQQLLSQGLMALCQVQPKGLAAVKWLSDWLSQNSSGKLPAVAEGLEGRAFVPPDRTQRFVEYGINQEGLPFAVEAPPAQLKQKKVIDVDVSEEKELHRVRELSTPFVVFVLGGPGSGKGTQCTRLREEFNLVHLSTGDLMREEVAAETFLGSEIAKHMQAGALVPESVTLQLLKKAMLRHQDTNRFLLDGFPRSVEQAKLFEQEIAEVAFALYFEATHETMRIRIAGRAVAAPGRMDDKPETVEKRLRVFEEQTVPVVRYYSPIGKLRGADAEREPDEVYAQARAYFCCRFLYLLGPPGGPVATISQRLEEKYDYSSINLTALLQAYSNSNEKDASKVKHALAKGKAVDAALACPLILAEIYRDMALGTQNFVICDFPQSPKQLEFLEYRVPCTSKPLLLDFSRADADDLAAEAAGAACLGGFVAAGMGALELEARTAAFYGLDAQDTLKSLPGLQRVPCSLAGLAGAGAGPELREQVLGATWAGVCEKVMPGLTIVLGPPGSGTDVLAAMLAKLKPNTHAVDCNQLLDRELERRTETGIAMYNMLARGQVVPLSMTLELLKNIVNLTCSDSLVIENCPMYVDQVEVITKEFRINRVYFISGDAAALHAWRDAYVSDTKTDDPAREAKSFDERVERLEQIVTHFSRSGMLERIEVVGAAEPEHLAQMIERAASPRFAIVGGLLASTTSEQASLLASAYGVGPPVSASSVEAWAKTKPNTWDLSQPDQFQAALKQLAGERNHPLIVLERYPGNAGDAAAFIANFGEPAAVVDFSCEDETLEEEYKATHEDEEIDPEELTAKLQTQRAAHQATVKVFEDNCPQRILKLAPSSAKTPEAMGELVRRRLLPRIHVVIAPSGSADLSGLIADAICASAAGEPRPTKFITIDCHKLFKQGDHSTALDDKLRNAALGEPDAIPVDTWVELFREAFARSADPMGNFLLINLPVRASSKVTVRFAMLQSIAFLEGVLHVRLSASAFAACCSDIPEELDAYMTESTVSEQALVQFGTGHICESFVQDAANPVEAADQVVAEFLAFRNKALGA